MKRSQIDNNPIDLTIKRQKYDDGESALEEVFTRDLQCYLLTFFVESSVSTFGRVNKWLNEQAKKEIEKRFIEIYNPYCLNNPISDFWGDAMMKSVSFYFHSLSNLSKPACRTFKKQFECYINYYFKLWVKENFWADKSTSEKVDEMELVISNACFLTFDFSLGINYSGFILRQLLKKYFLTDAFMNTFASNYTPINGEDDICRDKILINFLSDNKNSEMVEDILFTSHLNVDDIELSTLINFLRVFAERRLINEMYACSFLSILMNCQDEGLMEMIYTVMTLLVTTQSTNILTLEVQKEFVLKNMPKLEDNSSNNVKNNILLLFLYCTDFLFENKRELYCLVKIISRLISNSNVNLISRYYAIGLFLKMDMELIKETNIRCDDLKKCAIEIINDNDFSSDAKDTCIALLIKLNDFKLIELSEDESKLCSDFKIRIKSEVQL